MTDQTEDQPVHRIAGTMDEYLTAELQPFSLVRLGFHYEGEDPDMAPTEVDVPLAALAQLVVDLFKQTDTDSEGAA